MPREPAPAQQGTPLPLHGLDQVEIIASWVADNYGEAYSTSKPFARSKNCTRPLTSAGAVRNIRTASCDIWLIPFFVMP